MPFCPVNHSTPWRSKVAVFRLASRRSLGNAKSFTSRVAGSTRAIAFNVQVRRAADELARVRTWDEIVNLLAQVFGASEFDVVRLTVQKHGPASPRREYHLEDGLIVAVSHKEYIQLGQPRLLSMVRDNGCFIDVKSVFSPGKMDRGIQYWSL